MDSILLLPHSAINFVLKNPISCLLTCNSSHPKETAWMPHLKAGALSTIREVQHRPKPRKYKSGKLKLGVLVSLKGQATLKKAGTCQIRQLGLFPCYATEGGHKFKQTETPSAQLNIPTPPTCQQARSSDPAMSCFRKLTRSKLASLLVKLSELPSPGTETSPSECRRTRPHN